MNAFMKIRTEHRQVRLILFSGKKEIPLFRISPQAERIFVTAAYIGIISILVFHAEATHLSGRIEQKDHEIVRLQTQIDELLDLKKSLAALEIKEAELKEYFGLEKYAILESYGIGGAKTERTKAGIHMQAAPLDTHWRRWKNDSAERIELKIQKLIANYETFNRLIIKQNEIEKFTPNIVPVDINNPRVTSNFGWRKNPLTHKSEFHSGIDMIGPAGTRIVAPADGMIITCGYDKWLGKYMVLQHTPEIKTIFGHLKKVLLPEGKTVMRGQPIAVMGNTGMSTSRHLHYTITLNGRAIDPMQFILDLDTLS